MTPSAGGPLGPLPAGLDRPALLAAVAQGAASLSPGARVVVALSGGPDSTALAYLLTEAREDLDVHLVHVRHGLRDDRADRRAVVRHASWLDRPLRVVEVTVTPDGHGRQAAARTSRYAALREVAAEIGAEAIVLGHTADDQAETVLLRAARGTGTAGLAAMTTRRGDLLRPLLRVRRADLQVFLDGDGLPAVHDPSNRDRASRRVRARTEVLPLLAELAGDPVGALGRLASLAADDEAALQAAARPTTAQAVAVGATRSVPDAALAAVPVAVRRRVTRQLIAAVGGTPPDARATDRVEHLRPGGRLTLPDGTEVRVGGGWRCAAAPLQAHPPVAVAVPGPTAWPPAGVVLSTRTAAGEGDAPDPDQPRLALDVGWAPRPPATTALVAPPGGDPARSHLVLAGRGPWRLRHRAPGDRVATRVGTAKVARLLSDAGVPGPVRARWPVLVDEADRVVWVPGVAVDHELARAGRHDAQVQLILRAAPPVGTLDATH